MIEEYHYEVTKRSDKNKVAEEILKSVDCNYWNESTKREIANILEYADTAVVEHPYIDADFLSEYRLVYAGNFKNINNYTYRIIFFKENNLIGFVTLVPIYSKAHICRMFFNPYEIYNKDYKFLTKKYKIHFHGKEYYYRSFRAIRQEGCICVCGHSAIYGINNYASDWRGYTEKTAGEVSLATPEHSMNNNLTFSLNADDVLHILNNFGFNPKYKKFEEQEKLELISETLGYVQSGIPVLLIIGNLEHGVVAVGYKNFKINDSIFGKDINQSTSSTSNDIYSAYKKFNAHSNIFETSNNTDKTENDKLKDFKAIDANKLVDTFIINDDNRLPYIEIFKDSRPTKKSEYNWGIKDEDIDNNTRKNKGNNKYTIEDFEATIIPLYPKLILDYNQAKSVSLSFLMTNYPNGKFIYRTFLTSSNKYKEYILELKNSKNSKAIEKILLNVFPKFIWVTEIYYSANNYNDGIVDAEIVIDSTQPYHSPETVIMYLSNNQKQIFRELNGNFTNDDGNIQLKRFEKNTDPLP